MPHPPEATGEWPFRAQDPTLRGYAKDGAPAHEKYVALAKDLQNFASLAA
jgi:hypothetical protein